MWLCSLGLSWYQAAYGFDIADVLLELFGVTRGSLLFVPIDNAPIAWSAVCYNFQ